MASIRKNSLTFRRISPHRSIGRWLTRHGLETYEPLFRANEIDIDVAHSITEADLVEMGLSIGARRKLGSAIAELRGDPLTDRSPEAEPFPFERRQLTVFFCDLVGSTEMSQRMDPESFQKLCYEFLSTTRRYLDAFGGYTQQYQGDGVLACFGWPVGYGDQVARSIRAGLAIVKACNALKKPDGEPLSIRIGIATGLTVVGEMADECARLSGFMAGLTPNLAARLQELAESNQFLIDATTKAEIEELFDLEYLGFHRPKGLSAEVPVWRVIGETSATVGEQTAGTCKPAPLIGRPGECASVLSAWRDAREGQGQALVVSGDAGIGKTRLVQELGDLIDGEEHSIIRMSCLRDHIHSSLFPIAALFGIGERENPLGSSSSSAASQRLHGRGLDPAIAAIDAELSALFDPALSTSNRGETIPEERLANVTTLFLDYVASVSTHASLLILIEDIQWIDDTTLKLIDNLLVRISVLPILVLMTSRLPLHSMLRDEDRIRHIAITALHPRDCSALVRYSDPQGRLTETEIDAIVHRSDGFPLFAKELARSTIEAKSECTLDAGALQGAVDVPNSLRASLVSRIDRLGPAKRFLQACAAVGRTFTLDLVREILDDVGPDIGEVLSRSIDAGLISRHGTPANTTYIFTHALLQEVIYETLLISHRHELHRRIASTLLSGSQAFAEAHPEIVAQHFERAEIFDEAIEYYFRASMKSVRRHAHFEASCSSKRALDLLARTGKASSAHALDLWVLYGQSSFAIFGYGASQTRDAFETCRALMQETGSTKNADVIIRGLIACLFNRAEFKRALDIAEEYMERTLTQEILTPQDVFNAHRSVVGIYNALGRFRDADRHGRIALATLAEVKVEGGVRDLMSNRLLNTRAQLAISTWHGGNASDAERLSDKVIQEGNASASVHNRFIAMVYGGCIPQLLLGHRERLRYCASEVVSMSEGHRAPSFRAVGLGFLGGAHVQYGEIDRGRASLQLAFRLAKEQEQYIFTPIYHLFLAEADFAEERWDQTIATCDQGLSVSERTKEQWFDVHLRILKAEALNRGGWSSTLVLKNLELAANQAAEQQSSGLKHLVSRVEQLLRLRTNC
ncbi:ATP-binding protein [Roseovarius aestuarii]|uniref:Adenylate cyclase 1 n=1 Tax=Roseovarius aestuarii TaxID=475083 RepID=A0A1X7BWH9_9RHOB|nr:adenylate/guanylate cyclase domain-containing protein [Roseovarius aestuarii]SMC13997.1 Adenylate cyclase 1 [Roseovarius aestuarii]